MMSLIASNRLVFLASVSLTSGVEAAEKGVRRVTRSGLVEIASHGPVKRQNNNDNADDVGAALLQEELDNSRCQISQSATPPNAFATAAHPAGGDYALQSYENVAGAEECALLCASRAQCKTFYHVKDPNHPLFKQCTLTKWEGKLNQFAVDDCCDSGFPCSADDLTAPIKLESQILRQQEEGVIKRLNRALEVRQRKMVQKDAEAANDKVEIKRLNHALDMRQRIFIEKDMSMAAEKEDEARLAKEQALLADEVQALSDKLQKKSYYVYGLSSALVLTTILLLGFVAYVAWERWTEHIHATKPKQKSIQGNNAQLIAQ